VSRDGLDRLERLTIRVARVVAVLGLFALLALAALVLANATMRWLFAAPIDGVRDWEKLVIAFAIASCLPAALALRQNVTIRFLGHLSGKTARNGMELFGALATFVMFALLAWQLQLWTMELRGFGDTTENIGMKIWPWWQAVTVLFYFTLIVQLLVVVRCAAALIRGEDDDPEGAAEGGPTRPEPGAG
jgi:TRAP-type C4-dicarboxylate transport system permease small subunit